MKKATQIIPCTLLAGVCGFVGFYTWSKQLPPPLPFKDLTVQSFTSLIALLFAVALLVERAVEVIVTIFRDQQAALLNGAQELAQTAFDQANRALVAMASNSAASPTDRDKLAKVVEDTRGNLADAKGQNDKYRSGTKQVALLSGVLFGTLLSLAGLQALGGLLVENAAPQNLFKVTDVVVTTLMIAGGSEGIHRMANAFTSIMDTISTRADQAAKKTPLKPTHNTIIQTKKRSRPRATSRKPAIAYAWPTQKNRSE